MEQRFGNVTLGEINEMLILFIGKDMYLYFRGKVKDEAYNKYLSRLFKEDDKKVNLSALSLSDEKSIAKFVFEKILPDLQKTYSLSENLCKFMKDFVYSLYDRFTQNDMPILDYCSNFDSFRIQHFLEKAQQNYNLAFEKIRDNHKSLKNPYDENDGTVKNAIKAIRDHGKNFTWYVLARLLKKITDDKQITALLIDAYVMFNIYKSLKDKVKTNVIINIQYDATNMINSGIQYFFGDHGYKTAESRGNDILKTIEGQCPEAAVFYCNWFRGYHCVAKGELDDAKEYYIKAFAARRFAGCQFELFIKQAFALSNYLDFDADTVRKSADDNSTSKSPLSADAKKFWNYGYAAGIFEQKAEDIHQIVFHRVENFMKYFRTKMFLENPSFYKKLVGQFIKEKNIIKMPDYNSLNNEFEMLKKLSNININKRRRLMGKLQTKNLPIFLVLCYVEYCYSNGYLDLAKKFIALLKEWLDNFNLDFSLCSDKGCTIACDAIQQYKKLKLHQLDLDLAELKQIVLTIIEKSDVKDLIKNSLQGKRCALQEAIGSCDMDIVKAVVEKIEGIDNLRISADEESPIYYAISRYVCLYRYINDPNFKIQEGAINYNNLDFPGLTKEDKIRQMNKWKSNTELWEAAQKNTMLENYGKEEIWESELIEIQNICLYLIEHTKDHDSFVFNGNITSLLFAAESNNVEICRDLIKHNADPNKNYPDTFLQRCIYWGSFDVLAMYLEEFPDKAKVGINDIDNIFRRPLMKAFIFRFIQISIENKNYKDLAWFEHIVELFKKCGAIYNP